MKLKIDRHTVEGLFNPDEEENLIVCLDEDVKQLENLNRKMKYSIDLLLNEAIQMQESMRKLGTPDEELNEAIETAQQILKEIQA
jgi:hypothetical protein